MELAIINGTYRDSGSKQQQGTRRHTRKSASSSNHSCNPVHLFVYTYIGMESAEPQLKQMQMPMLRHPGLGAPLIISPQHLLAQHIMNGGHPSLLSQHHDPGALFFSRPYDFGAAQYAHNLLAASAPHLLEFQTQSNQADGLASGGLIQLTTR